MEGISHNRLQASINVSCKLQLYSSISSEVSSFYTVCYWCGSVAEVARSLAVVRGLVGIAPVLCLTWLLVQSFSRQLFIEIESIRRNWWHSLVVCHVLVCYSSLLLTQ
jgi:hypothetical protein